MLDVSIRYHFNDGDYDRLKAAAALYLGEVKPTHRMEIVARWCGYTTLASFRTGLRNGSANAGLVLAPAPARNFAESVGAKFEALSGHRLLASAAASKVAHQFPQLHGDGYGRHSVYVSDADRRNLRRSSPPGEVGRAIYMMAEVRFERSREDMLAGRNCDEFIRALAFCSELTPIKTLNPKQSSYGLKHRAEERSYRLAGGVELPRDYVSNSSFIAAAFYTGFSSNADRPHRDQSNPNLIFNISQKSLNEVIKRAPSERGL